MWNETIPRSQPMMSFRFIPTKWFRFINYQRPLPFAEGMRTGDRLETFIIYRQPFPSITTNVIPQLQHIPESLLQHAGLRHGDILDLGGVLQTRHLLIRQGDVLVLQTRKTLVQRIEVEVHEESHQCT